MFNRALRPLRYTSIGLALAGLYTLVMSVTPVGAVVGVIIIAMGILGLMIADAIREVAYAIFLNTKVTHYVIPSPKGD